MKPIDQLRHMRDELRRQLEANEVFVAWYEADEAVRRAEAKIKGEAAFVSDLVSAGRDIARGKRSTMWLTESQVEELRRDGPDAMEASYAAIAEARRPLPTSELVAAIEAKGVRLNGKNPLKVFRTRLSKDDRFRSVQVGPSQKTDRGWWLVELPEPTPDFGPPDRSLPDLSRGYEPQKDSAPEGHSPPGAVNGSGGG